MSKENVKKFFELIIEDVSIAEQVFEANVLFAEREQKSLEEMSDEDKKNAISEIILPIAEKAGLGFTAEEYFEAEAEAIEAEDEELFEDELENIAGGTSLENKIKVPVLFSKNLTLLNTDDRDSIENIMKQKIVATR